MGQATVMNFRLGRHEGKNLMRRELRVNGNNQMSGNDLKVHPARQLTLVNYSSYTH